VSVFLFVGGKNKRFYSILSAATAPLTLDRLMNRQVSYYQDVAKKLQQLENLPVVQFFSSAASSSLPRKDHNFLDEVNRRVWDIKQASNLKPNSCPNVFDSVADPNPNPPDPHVFGPGSGSGSISQRYGSGSGN
jgi:hypothetical protein